MRIYDNNGDTFDRYTILYPECQRGLSGFTILGASSDPFTGVGGEFWEQKTRLYRVNPEFGKRIKWSGLPDRVKEFVLSRMSLPNFRLPKLSTRYGAPMGRSNTARGKCQLGKIRPVDGDYDNGGAYWGFGRDSEDIYVAKSKNSWVSGHPSEDPGFSFVRANSPYEAVKQFESMGLTF